MTFAAFLRWLFAPSDLVSVQWLKDQTRRESGRGIEQSRIDWDAMRNRDR